MAQPELVNRADSDKVVPFGHTPGTVPGDQRFGEMVPRNDVVRHKDGLVERV